MRRRALFNAVLRAALLLVLVFLVGLRVWPRHPTGFRVRIASDTCVGRGSGIFLLNVTSKGEVLINSGPLEMSALASELSDIYATRSERVLYFSADDNVPFQKIADVIDAVQQSTQTRVTPLPEALRNSAADRLNIEMRLVTPGAVNTPCHEHCYNWWKEGLHLHLE